MEEQKKLQKELIDIGAEIGRVSAQAESAKDAELGRYYREKELVLRKEKLLLLERLGARASEAGLGVESATGSANPTTAYLEDCLKPPAAGRGTLCAMLLYGDVEALQQCLATPVAPGLPLPPLAAAEMPRSLRRKLAPETQQATPNELSMHVYGAVCDDLQPAGTGCSSEMYTAFLTHRLLERTWWLIAKHRRVTWLDMDRNGADASVRLQRPDFMVWVKKALLFKGEEKAGSGNLPLAVDELTSKTTEAWAAGLLPAVPRPCMLAYAAAGSRLQFFCLKPTPPDSTGKPTGGGSSSSGGSGSRRVRAEPISTVLELSGLEGRLAVVTAAFNIWRLLDDYANSAQPVPAFPIGQSIKSAGSHVSFHPGYVRKTIPAYRLSHERYVSFELLARLYERLRGPQHRHAIIKASQLPRLDADGTYVVHLAPLGRPCTGPPDTEEELAAAVAGVLRGLAALHAEGYVHRDVRWANVIYLPEDGRWMLIDLEHAGLEGCDCSGSPFPLRYWSPRTLPPDKVYRAASDLRMAAEQLMCGLRFTLGDAARDLREQLMRAVEADNGGSGLTAEQALKHPWLAAAAAGPW